MKNVLFAVLIAVMAVCCISGCGRQHEPSVAEQLTDLPSGQPSDDYEEHGEGICNGLQKPIRVGDSTVNMGYSQAEEPGGTPSDTWDETLVLIDKDGQRHDFSQYLRGNAPEKWLARGDILYVVAGDWLVNGGNGELASFDGRIYRLNTSKRKIWSVELTSSPELMAVTKQGLVVVGNRLEVDIFDPDSLKLRKHLAIKLPKLDRWGQTYITGARLLPSNQVKITGGVNIPEVGDCVWKWDHYPYGDWSVIYDLNTQKIVRLHLPKRTKSDKYY